MTEPKTMLAAVYERYGPPEVLSLKTVPIPEYGDDDVLIRVHFSTVNRTDCGFLRAEPFVVRFVAGLTRPKNQVSGSEFSGEVIAIGSAVTDYQPGDRVFGFKDDDHGFGGHAQYTRMPVKGLMAKIPEHVSYAEAAPGLEGSHYALCGIHAAGMHKQQRALVNGATGSIGSAALQILRSMDISVTAVCATPYTEKVAALGAAHVVDYLKEDFTQLDEQFDVVFDSVGKSSFGQCKRILSPNGIYQSTELGALCQNPFLAMLTSVLGKQQVQFPIPKNSRADADYLCDLMRKKQFEPLVDRTYSLENIADAFRYVETGEKIGNVLIEIP